MNTELTALAREIARLKPDWARPGMACVDPETVTQWRLHGDAWRSFPRVMESYLWSGRQSRERAIAAGPDLTDAATVGALLMAEFPDADLGQVTSLPSNRRYSWRIELHERFGDYALDKPCAHA